MRFFPVVAHGLQNSSAAFWHTFYVTTKAQNVDLCNYVLNGRRVQVCHTRINPKFVMTTGSWWCEMTAELPAAQTQILAYSHCLPDGPPLHGSLL